MTDATSNHAATLTGHHAGCAKFPYPDRAIMRREFHCDCGAEPRQPSPIHLYLRFVRAFLTGGSA